MSERLKRFLELCKEQYYAGYPIISDDQYDNLEEICKEDLSVGTNKGRVRHWNRMYSLQKVYEDEFDSWPADYIVTPKLDGAAIAIRYIRGKLDSLVTRGDGQYGEDITHLFDHESCINLAIPTYLKYEITGQVTGEIVAPESIKNARNYAAGALNLDDIEEFHSRNLCFFAYDVEPNPFKTYEETLGKLRSIGFFPVDFDEMTCTFPRDGLVFRINDNSEYQRLGFTSKHPRGAFALKKRSEGIKTKILDVIWQTGKTGKVTPVAILDPVEIEDATVSRATLNNPGFIEALGVRIGDSVMVERAGGIIPRIIKKAE
jgi:DNA ligase (NAD+)